jgi:hypothetical protein
LRHIPAIVGRISVGNPTGNSLVSGGAFAAHTGRICGDLGAVRRLGWCAKVSITVAQLNQ